MGTFGYLRTVGFQCFTVELPWDANKPYVSCIPPGKYNLTTSVFLKGGYGTLEVQDVPGRSRILFHVANTIDDLLGCIGPGKYLSWVNGKWAVGSSQDAFHAFMSVVRDLSNDYISDIQLTVKELEVYRGWNTETVL